MIAAHLPPKARPGRALNPTPRGRPGRGAASGGLAPSLPPTPAPHAARSVLPSDRGDDQAIGKIDRGADQGCRSTGASRCTGPRGSVQDPPEVPNPAAAPRGAGPGPVAAPRDDVRRAGLPPAGHLLPQQGARLRSERPQRAVGPRQPLRHHRRAPEGARLTLGPYKPNSRTLRRTLKPLHPTGRGPSARGAPFATVSQRSGACLPVLLIGSSIDYADCLIDFQSFGITLPGAGGPSGCERLRPWPCWRPL